MLYKSKNIYFFYFHICDQPGKVSDELTETTTCTFRNCELKFNVHFTENPGLAMVMNIYINAYCRLDLLRCAGHNSLEIVHHMV